MSKNHRGGDPQPISELIAGPQGRIIVAETKGKGKKAPNPPWARFKASVEWKSGKFWTGPSLDYLPRADLRNDPNIIRVLDENQGFNQLMQCLRERSHLIRKAKIWASSSNETYTLPPARFHNVCVFSWTNGHNYAPMKRVLQWEQVHRKKELIRPVKCVIESLLDLEHLSHYPEGSINPTEFWR